MPDLPPLIDIHTHIGHLPGVVGEVFSPEDLCYILDHEGVRLMLASSASTTTISQEYGTTETIAMVERYGVKIKGMLWINPHDPDWPGIVSRINSQQFVGIKIHPVLDHYAVDFAALEPVFACARQHHWPILTHTDHDGTPMSALCYEPLIKAFPDVVLILAHLRLEAIPLARRYENVFVDTTYVDPLMVEVGLAALGPDKILFGSDAAEGFEVGHQVALERPRRSYAALVAALRQRGISEGELIKILFENALGLFKLSV
jgi:predicted TIM-barrel fold metal-dependent hydrolase